MQAPRLPSTFSNRTRALLVAGLVLLVMALGAAVLWKTGASQDEPTPALSSDALAMRKDPSPWVRTERDVSVLAADIAAGRVQLVGIAPQGVLVQTRDGARYSVRDTERAKVAELVLRSFQEETVPRFETVAIGPVAALGSPSGGMSGLEVASRVMGIVFPLTLLVVLVVMFRGGLGTGFKVVKGAALRFEDVVGAKEAKSAMGDLVAWLRDPKAFAELGSRPPKGVLMVGPPGTGKTRLAQALAGEAGVSFIAASGSDFTSKFFGMGPQKVRTLFATARKHAPCIVFLDELDGLGRRTSAGQGPAESESNRIINQMLVEMDGFGTEQGVLVIGATNLVDNLDEALLREGRFDRRVHVKLPDLKEREALFQMYVRPLKLGADVEFAQLARMSTGFSPAAIAYVANHAGLIAARARRSAVTMADFVEAIEVRHMGEANGSGGIASEAERRRVAVHEAGHAIASHVLGVGRLEKVTIAPRGAALGVTLVTQPDDKQLHLKSELENRLVMMLGGRCAELVTFEEASSGAAQDLEEASKLALTMVSRLGFGASGSLFSLAALAGSPSAAQETTRAVQEARELLAQAEARCLQLLQAHASALRAVTEALLEQETIAAQVVVDACARSRAG